MANPRVGNMVGRFECAGGIDVDPGAIRNFELMTGARGTVLDLFNETQYRAFHGKEPPRGWREASPADIYRAFGPAIDVAFASMPCKGFSGLLSARQSETDKYQALNGLTLRGMWLLLEAYKDEPIPIILFENVPRIRNRGRWLLDQIIALYRSYGYVHSEDVHDCGEIGGLGQSRKRALVIFRHHATVPPFVYRPPVQRLKGVGEIIGKLPLPGDPLAGVMHRVPALQWQTWVRLAFVPAGRDWRALNELQVVDGNLRDFGIVPEIPLRDNALGVCAWGDTAPLVTGARAPGQGRFSVADPRPAGVDWNSDILGVRNWADPTGTVAGRSSPTNGSYSVADPRPSYGPDTHQNILAVTPYEDPSKTISGAGHVAGGALSVADPRPSQGNQTYGQYGVRQWTDSAGAVTGQAAPGGGPNSVADPRLHGRPRFNNTFRIVSYDSSVHAIAGPGGPAGGHCVADPRAPHSPTFKKNKYKVTAFDEAAGSVIGASTTGDGAFAVADPRGGPEASELHGKYRIEDWAGPSRAVTAGSDNGAFAVADPRCSWGNGRHESVLRITPYDDASGTIPGAVHSVTGGQPCVADQRRDSYQTSGHYGVVGWNETAGTVAASASHDNGRGSVADPRDVELDVAEVTLPRPKDRVVCRIVALDDTWHRPFTTLELASLQSLFEPEEAFYIDDETGRWAMRAAFHLEGTSDAVRREWIGNAVPSLASKAMAETIGETLLLAEMGETFTLSTREIWVKPLALALSVDNSQVAFDIDAGRH